MATAERGRWLAEAAKPHRASPSRSAAQIVDMVARVHGVWLSERTVRGHLHRLGLSRQALSAEPARAYGRFQASRPNEIWVGDVLHGPFVPFPRVPGSKRAKLFRTAKLFVLVDDGVRHEAPHNRVEVKGLHRWVVAAA